MEKDDILTCRKLDRLSLPPPKIKLHSYLHWPPGLDLLGHPSHHSKATLFCSQKHTAVPLLTMWGGLAPLYLCNRPLPWGRRAYSFSKNFAVYKQLKIILKESCRYRFQEAISAFNKQWTNHYKCRACSILSCYWSVLNLSTFFQ